jgi:nucleoside-diphosphate-sugar epimerase
MKYVVTGGAGFIGSNIVEALVKNGEDVVVIDDLSTGQIENITPFLSKIKFIRGSINNIQLLHECFAGADYVLHQAAIPSVPRSIEKPIATNEANISGTLNVFVAARDCNVKKVVYASSSSVYGDTQGIKTETLYPNPQSPYALTKLTSEQYAKIFSQLFGLKTIGLRYFNVFGPRQNPHSNYAAVIPCFINKILNKQSPIIFGDGLNSRDFCYVKNVVNANLLACKSQASNEIMNIATGKKHTLLQLVEKINKLIGQNIDPIHAEPRIGDIRHSLADIAKAKTIINYSVEIDFDEGLQKTIDWFIQINANKLK